MVKNITSIDMTRRLDMYADDLAPILRNLVIDCEEADKRYTSDGMEFPDEVNEFINMALIEIVDKISKKE